MVLDDTSAELRSKEEFNDGCYTKDYQKSLSPLIPIVDYMSFE